MKTAPFLTPSRARLVELAQTIAQLVEGDGAASLSFADLYTIQLALKFLADWRPEEP